MKILIVDDEEIALTSLQRVLKRAGISTVTLCCGGRETIEQLCGRKFAIVLLDILCRMLTACRCCRRQRRARGQL